MIDKYKVFLEVLNTQNVTKAAENIHSTPPAVSYTINKLEEILGVDLLISARGKMLPTQEALELLPLIQEVVDAQKRVEVRAQELSSCEGGIIRIGGLRAACIRWLPGLMKMLLEEAPEITLQPIMDSLYKVNDDLLAHRLDVAISENRQIKSLEYIKITDDPYMVVLPANHPLANCREIALSDLKGERLLGPPWPIKEGDSPKIHFEIQKMAYCRIMDTGTILSLVENNYAIAILTSVFVPEYHSGLRCVPLKNLAPKSLGLLYTTTPSPNKTMRRFLKIAKNYFRQISLM